MKYFFIIKPPIKRKFLNLFSQFQKENFLVFFETQREGEFNAENLAKRAIKEGFDRIIVVGGDGLINEAVNGAMKELSKPNSLPIFGIIPQGTGNNFAQELGIPKDIRLAFKTLKEGKIIQVDIGKVNNRFFVNCFSLGFDAEINHLANEIKEKFKFLPKNLSYFFAAIKKIIQKIPEFEIEIEGKEISFKEKITLLAITNTQSYGAIFKINPDAEFSDGKFNLCLIKPVKKIKAIYDLFLAINGKHYQLPEVKHSTFTNEIKIIAKSPVFWEVDGEVLKPEKEFLVKIFPKAIKILVP